MKKGKKRFRKNHRNESMKVLKPSSLCKKMVDKFVAAVREVSEPKQVDTKPVDVAMIYTSELEYIKSCILEYPDIETGGQLFGFWTPKGCPVVLYAIGSGPKAGHQSTFFSQDIDYLDTVGGAIVKNFGLKHIGEWHSHHKLGLAHPSGHDASNMQSNIDRLGLGHFLLCIGNCNDREAFLSPFNFQQGSTSYQNSEWQIVNIDSPFRAIIDTSLKSWLIHPHNYSPAYSTLSENQVSSNTSNAVQQKHVIYKEGYWLCDHANDIVLKKIADFVSDENKWGKISIKLDEQTKLVHIFVSSNEKIDHDICFVDSFPEEAPQITYYDHWSGKPMPDNQRSWKFNGYIYDSFKNYYNM